MRSETEFTPTKGSRRPTVAFVKNLKFDPGGTQTHDQAISRRSLYSSELRGRIYYNGLHWRGFRGFSMGRAARFVLGRVQKRGCKGMKEWKIMYP